MVLMSYQPLYIKGMEQGLVQSRIDFILPDDAYPVLENAYVWRERIKRKKSTQLLGRLRRVFAAASIGNSNFIGAAPEVWTINTIYSTYVPAVTPEANAEIEPGSVIITIALGVPVVLTDDGNGTFTTSDPNVTGTIDYTTGIIVLSNAGAAIAPTATTASFNYFPNLPVMGIRLEELNAINTERTIVFDTIYAYKFGATGWVEFIPGTTWTGSDSDFFWTTNYWVDASNIKVFWVTNYSGTGGDPIRYTNGSTWVNFAPQINAAGDVLAQCLILLPFRGRLVAFNTYEGINLAGSVVYQNRIRWAAIGNPFR